jgi:hypothetical protein
VPEYEIVVLKNDCTSTSFIFEQTHSDDYAAVRAAARFAGANLFEVWRGIECIYGVSSDRNILPMTSDYRHLLDDQGSVTSAE